MELSLGTVQLGLPYGINNSIGALTDAQAWAVLDAARVCGFTMLDTSHEYGDAMVRIGRYMLDHPMAFKVVVKYSAQYPSMMLQALRAKTRRMLGDGTLSMYWTAGESVKNLNPEGFDGVTVYDVEEAQSIPDGFSMVQVPASVLDGRMDEEIANLQHKGKIVLVRSLLLQGLLAMNPWDRPRGNVGNGKVTEWAHPYLRELHRIAFEAGMSSVEVAARWAYWLMPDVAIFGAETPEQVWHLAGIMSKGPLSYEITEQLFRLSVGIPDIVISPRMWGQDYPFTTIKNDD